MELLCCAAFLVEKKAVSSEMQMANQFLWIFHVL